MGNLKIHLGSEDKIISDRYNSVMRKILARKDYITPTSIYSSPNGPLIVNVPYWVAGSMDTGISLSDLRSLAVGNLLGTSYVLVQDKIIDGQETKFENMQESLLFSTLIYYESLKEYQRVFRSHHYFWALFEKYLREFVNVSLWEKRKHYGNILEYETKDLLRLGRKLSMVKVSIGGVCLLGGRESSIEIFSELIDNYHAGYQMFDDVVDWKEDLVNKNYTYFLMKIRNLMNLDEGAGQVEAYLKTNDLIRQHLRESDDFYLKAAKLAQGLNCTELENFIRNKIKENDNFTEASGNDRSTGYAGARAPARDAALESELTLSRIHVFEKDRSYYVYLVDRNVMIRVDRTMYDFVRSLRTRTTFRVSDIVEEVAETERNDLLEMLGELLSGGILTENHPAPGDSAGGADFVGKEKENREVLVSLGLLTTGVRDNEIRIISPETAKGAIDFLLLNSGYMNDLFIHLFVDCVFDEPIISLLEEILDYAKRSSIKLFKNVSVSVNIDVPSINGNVARGEEDIRKLIGGIRTCFERTDSQNAVINLRVKTGQDHELLKWLEKSLSDEGSNGVQICTQPFCIEGNPRDVAALEIGTGSVRCRTNGDMQLRLRSRKKRDYFCNAGKSYVAVSIDGDYYPCHLFARAGMNSMGSLREVTVRSQSEYIESDAKSAPRCADCWLTHICGGGCIFMEKASKNSPGIFDRLFCDPYRGLAEEAMVERLVPCDSTRPESKGHDIRPCDNF